MGRFKDFLLAMPVLCKVSNAKRWSKLIEWQFDDEISNRDSVFARNEVDEMSPTNRMETAFGFTSIGNEEKISHCKKLVELKMLSHYKYEHYEVQWDNRINTLQKELSILEIENPEIYEVYTMNEALEPRWEV
jgi:hypothetical protein